MGYRLFDFRCQLCGSVHEDMVFVPTGEKSRNEYDMHCPDCGDSAPHDRLMSRPAKYTGDMDVWGEVVGGKRFDTMGYRDMPSLPTLPSGASEMDYKYLCSSPEYKEIRAERRRIQKQNRRKRERAAARAKGERVNLRSHPLEGDPKV